MPVLVQKSIQAAEEAASRPTVRVLVCAYLLAAVWLTPAAGSTGQSIQAVVATVLIAVAAVDIAVVLWGNRRRFLAVLAVMAAGLFWWLTVGGWVL